MTLLKIRDRTVRFRQLSVRQNNLFIQLSFSPDPDPVLGKERLVLGWCGVHLPGPSDSNQIQHTLALTQTLELQSIEAMVISSVATQPGSALELQTKVPKDYAKFYNH